MSKMMLSLGIPCCLLMLSSILYYFFVLACPSKKCCDDNSTNSDLRESSALQRGELEAMTNRPMVISRGSARYFPRFVLANRLLAYPC